MRLALRGRESSEGAFARPPPQERLPHTRLRPQHSLFNLCQLRDRPGGTTKRQIGRAVAARKAIEEEIRRVCELASQRKGRLEYDDARSHLCEFGMADAFLCVPPYLRSIINEMRGWEVQATKTQHVVLDVPREPRDIFAWWRAGTDLKVRELHEKQRRHESKKLVKQHRSAKTQQIEYTKMDGRLAVILPDTSPQAPENDDAGGDQTKPSSDAADGQPAWREPTSKRKIGKLISDGDVWNFSRWERLQLMQHIAETIICSVGPQLARLQSRLADLNATIKSYNDEERLDVLRAAEVIGATTNGCANIVDLISKVRPAIVLVEEAGECVSPFSFERCFLLTLATTTQVPGGAGRRQPRWLGPALHQYRGSPAAPSLDH